MDVDAYSEGRPMGVQKNMESNQTSKKKRFIDWFTRKTQKISLKPVRMGTKPVPKVSSNTRKSRKSVVPVFDEPMSWVPNRSHEKRDEKQDGSNAVVLLSEAYTSFPASPPNATVLRTSALGSNAGEPPSSALRSYIRSKKECDMMSIIPYEPTNCSYMGNLAANTFLHSYLSKTPDNSGWVLDLSTGKSTVGIDMGKQNCEKIRKNLKKLIPYIKCDIVKKIHMILLYGHEFRKSHIPIMYFLFKVFESVDEIHFGISDDFVLTDKIKDEFVKKGISIGIGKDGSGKRYIKVVK